ncbi:rhomboid family intramembrane serine protease [Thiohalophilus sp.]|uniref:rhomboid family intramembrane serine protease n=1 Tax=Thiohalophilus sp. TaxID=3028392 RepID=UPI002ACD6945|nr:rhomboid family intramembrane serine protease [Thiohalophilus sp.]MDZ7805359.1 rhomboid family intramembrane serine protease [Thiohalophilus sp.]
MNHRNAFPVPVVPALLIINGILFLMEMTASGRQLIELFALWPLGSGSDFGFGSGLFDGAAPGFQVWQLVTYSFLHGGVFHLLVNMYALWLFGSRMEMVWGSKAFLIYYFVCVIGAALVQLLVASQGSGPAYPTIGASGGVFGLLLAFGMTFPNEKLMLLFPPVAMSAKWFVIIYGAVELYFGVTGSMAGVAHFAHLGGMLFGYLLIRYWRSHPPRYR